MDNNKFTSGTSRSNRFPAWPFFIREREDVVFIHIPKTAGTSIRWSLDFNRVDKTSSVHKHTKTKDIISLLGKECWDSAFKFSFVRNPWDRLLSMYHFRLRKDMISDKEHQKSFKQWAFFELKERDPNTANPFNLEPQMHWLRDQQEKLSLNFIGRYETLDQDFKHIATMCSRKGDLLHLNSNPVKLDYRQHYDLELKLLVADYYQEDIEYFNYEF